MHTLWLFIKLILWGVFIFSFLHTFLTHFMLWLELRLLRLQDKEQPPIPWQNLTKSFFIEFFCIFITCFLAPFRSWSFSSKTASTEMTATPILLIHGYLHHQNSWAWFTRQLRKKSGIGPIYSINLSPPFASIMTLAEQVKNKINEIQTETNAKQVILIGHSMGGLVSSYFGENLATPNQVAMIITLGTPFKGTLTAALGYGQNAEEMSPESPFLITLLEKIQQSNIPYFSIVSKIDNMVIPWQSGMITDESSSQTAVFEDFGHLRLLISPAVVERVTKWIIP